MKANTIISILMSCAVALSASGGQLVSNPANQKGVTYVNPIIHADYSDPDAVASADGKTFYMTASSFQCTPGLPILKSTDLVNWTLVNYALSAVPPADFYDAAPRHGKGVWAPCIKYYNGEYYIYWGDPDYGIFMIKTTDPEGKWSDPVMVKSGMGLIDPSPLWDDDGRAYLINGWAASRAGFNSVLTVSEMDPSGECVVSAPRVVVDGNDGVNHTIEGPKFYKRGDYYYIFAPAGGVENGWQLVMRSKNVYGPYESKIVMAQGASDINGPHQGAWIRTQDGEDWFLHFQDHEAYGRLIHLNPMMWRDDWPVIGDDKDGDGCGDPVRKWCRPRVCSKDANENASVQENKAQLFQWHSNYKDMYGFPTPEAMMRLYGHKVSEEFVNMWEVPNLWLMKFPAEEFTMTSKLRISAKGNADGVSSGIIVMGWDYCRLGLEKRGNDFVLIMTTCTDAEQGGKENMDEVAVVTPTRVYAAGLYPNMECEIILRVQVNAGGICRFSYSLDGTGFNTIKQTFKARAGKWIGAKAGFYSITPAGVNDRGWMDVMDCNITVK